MSKHCVSPDRHFCPQELRRWQNCFCCYQLCKYALLHSVIKVSLFCYLNFIYVTYWLLGTTYVLLLEKYLPTNSISIEHPCYFRKNIGFLVCIINIYLSTSASEQKEKKEQNWWFEEKENWSNANRRHCVGSFGGLRFIGVLL